MAQPRVLPQSKETLLQSYNKRLKDDVKSIMDNFTEIIKTAKVGLSRLPPWEGAKRRRAGVREEEGAVRGEPFVESPNVKGFKGILKIVSFHSLPWAETPYTRPGCSKPYSAWPWTLCELNCNSYTDVNFTYIMCDLISHL